MAIITGGSVISSNRAGGEATPRYTLNGAPAGGEYEGSIKVGELLEDVTTGTLYECTGVGPTTFAELTPPA